MKLNKRLKFILLSLLCGTSAWASNNICPLRSREVNEVSIVLLDPINRLSQNKNRFFIGLYSKLESDDRKQMGQALKEVNANKMGDQLEVVHKRLAERILSDKELLENWVIMQDLEEQVKILDFPKNNYFLMFDATKEAITKVVCAAAAGDLPKAFLDIGY